LRVSEFIKVFKVFYFVWRSDIVSCALFWFNVVKKFIAINCFDNNSKVYNVVPCHSSNILSISFYCLLFLHWGSGALGHNDMPFLLYFFAKWL
jgi:hypothetical protein